MDRDGVTEALQFILTAKHFPLGGNDQCLPFVDLIMPCKIFHKQCNVLFSPNADTTSTSSHFLQNSKKPANVQRSIVNLGVK